MLNDQAKVFTVASVNVCCFVFTVVGVGASHFPAAVGRTGFIMEARPVETSGVLTELM